MQALKGLGSEIRHHYIVMNSIVGSSVKFGLEGFSKKEWENS